MEAQEIIADVPGDSVMNDYHEVDPKKVEPIQMGKILRKYVSRRLVARSEEEIEALTTAMKELVPMAVLRLSPSSISSA